MQHGNQRPRNDMAPLVYLTGATGYVGTFLSSFLRARGYTVEPISVYPKKKLLRLQADQLNLDKNSVVIHLSENADSDAGQLGPSEVATAEHNARILSDSASSVVYFSSCRVYETTTDKPHDESSCNLAETPYAKFKLLIERALNGDKDLILRPTNLYHRKIKRETILGHLLATASNTDGPRLRDPSAQIDFIHLDDIAEFICVAIAQNLSGVFNCASGKLTSGFDLIEALKGGDPTLMSHVPSPYDNRKFMEALGHPRLRSVIDDLQSEEGLCLTQSPA